MNTLSDAVSQSKQLLAARDIAQNQFDSQRNTLEDLDELADIMAEMVESQRSVEVGPTRCCRFLCNERNLFP
jgi:hypothetical protein